MFCAVGRSSIALSRACRTVHTDAVLRLALDSPHKIYRQNIQNIQNRQTDLNTIARQRLKGAVCAWWGTLGAAYVGKSVTPTPYLIRARRALFRAGLARSAVVIEASRWTQRGARGSIGECGKASWTCDTGGATTCLSHHAPIARHARRRPKVAVRARLTGHAAKRRIDHLSWQRTYALRSSIPHNVWAAHTHSAPHVLNPDTQGHLDARVA